MKKFLKILNSALNLFVPIIFALVVGAVFIALSGKNPFYVYQFLADKAIFNRIGFLNTLATATPIIMTGLGIAVSFKAGLFNMGIEGQLYMGAFFATYLGFTLKGLPHLPHVVICLMGGVFMGMLFSVIPAVLKAYLHVNEMVVTMMLNYASIIFTKYLVNGPFSAKIGYPTTPEIFDSAKMTRFFLKVPLTFAIFLALTWVIVVEIIYRKTKLGYEIETMGKHINFADSVGMRVDRCIIKIFLLSGAISGMAGATEMLSVHYRFTPGFSTNPGLGWDGMLIALLASHEPIGVLIAAFFFGALKYGGTTLQTFVGISNDTIGIIQASLIVFLSVRYIHSNSRFMISLEHFTEKLKKQHT